MPGKVAVGIAIVLSGAILTGFQTQQQKKKLREAEKKARNRIDVLLRSATEAQRIIYGERRVSGVLTYANVRLSTGTVDNSDLWQVIALAGHEVTGITDLYLDGDKIPAASINGSGEVIGGKYAPINGRPTVQILKNLGSDTQSALSIGFADWTSNHRLRGVAHIATRFELSTRGSGGLWKNGAPSNVRVTVQGKKVYDPRLDSTAGGSGSHRVTDPSTWEYSANPALCLADYLIDSRLGMGQEGITSDDIDYEMVATAADQCDATVSVPGGTEARYELNGVLFSTDSYEKNILDILSCMNGTMVWSNGQFRIRAGEYEAPVESFDEDDIIGAVAISAERGREERINKIRGSYANADEDYALTQYIPVEDANLIANRDNGNELVETIDQPLVTSEYQAQRLAFKLIQINNQQLRATLPLNYRAMNVRVGDRIQVSVDALNWSNKIFRVESWKFGVEDGFVLSVIEDSSTAYDDPEVADYSTRSATGTITFADPPVPSPSGLTATAERNGILVQWDEPEPPVLYDEVQVFASPDSSWSNAVLVASTRGTTFFHDLDPGTERYYWARAIDNKDDLSDRDPDSDTSSITATSASTGVGDIAGATDIANALFNPGFELGDIGYDKGIDWTIESTASARRGSWAGKFDGSGLTAMKNNYALAVEPGERVMAHVFSARASGTGSVYGRIAWLNAAGGEIAYSTGPTVTSSSFAQSRVLGIAPAGAVGAEVHAVADGGGSAMVAYVDDFFLSAVPRDADIDALATTNGPAEAGADVTGDHSADVDVLLTQNAPAEAGADVTGNHSADVDVLLTQNAPRDAASTRGVIDASSAETDGAVSNSSTTTYTTAQTLTFTLSESTTVVITMTGLIYRVGSSSTTFSQVRARKGGTEIGGMSALNTFVPGTSYQPWVYRREETLAAGTYTYDFQFRQVAGGITTAFRNRVITVEEVL